jgi:hypothetical protein
MRRTTMWLTEHVLGCGDRVSVEMAVADVLDQQPEQLVGLLGGPVLPRRGLRDDAFHSITPRGTAAGDRPTEPLGPGVVET